MIQNNQSYELFSLPEPFNRAPHELSTVEAKQYFNWFMDQMPFRLQILKDMVASTIPEPLFSSLSEQAFYEMGVWLDKHLDMRELSPEEIEQNLVIFPQWIHSSLPKMVLSERSISLCMDIGIYFGKMMIHNHPTLFWDYVRKPKSDANFQKTVISGFPKKMNLNPVQIVYVIANKKMNGVSTMDEFTTTYNVWSSMV